MSTLYIAELARSAVTSRGPYPAAELPPITNQTVAIGGTTAQSSAFNAATRLIRVHTDATVSIAIGANPVATTSSMRVAAGATEYFGVNPGDKIAAIANS